ncbi:hypothetical protein PMSD_06115 [Paenibacillus macquariensis subsp. defensor]|nr:hypothetical protein PMSD_06115 [Paenibacillus macquariensis subsp. defensor]
MNEDIIYSLIGKTINFTRLAGNSLIIYLDCIPGEDKGYSIWLEPTWHLHDESKVIIGSRQLQIEDEKELVLISKPLNDLILKQIKGIEINSISKDLTVIIDQYYLKSFVADPTDEYIWQIRDIGNKKMIEANTDAINLRDYSEE